MKRNTMILVLVLSCMMFTMSVGLAFASDHPLLEEAKKEGKGIYYANITGVDDVMEAFQAKYGVEVEYTRIATSVYVPTVMTEFQANRLMGDVLQAPIPILQILKEAGVLESYISPVSENYPDWSKDPDGMIQQFGIETVALIYNTEHVKADEVPKSYRELADPKWQDRIVMPDPLTHATTITWLVGLKEHVFETEQEWLDFLAGLAKNRPMFVASFGPTPGPLETGEKHIGISMPKYIVTKAPAPLNWAKVEGEPLMGSARAIALVKNSERPNTAKMFMDFWLSEEAAAILATDVGETVLYDGVYPPIEDIDQAEIIALRELSDEEIQQWSDLFSTIF